MRTFLSVACFILLCSCELIISRCSASSPQDEFSDQDKQQITAAEKFLKILEKSPRKGTAFDKIYAHAVEFGTLNQLLDTFQKRVAQDAKDSDAWMILGLLQSQRGEDENASHAFRNALDLRPHDAMAPYYLGQSLVRLGQTDAAAAMLEQSIAREPAKVELLEIYQQLGRLYQRSQRTQDALKVWQRLESVFPNDARVQEQIAVSLLEEGDFQSALPRYQSMAANVKDDYRRVQYRILAADVMLKLNRKPEAIEDLEKTLANLNPDSWLHRDVRKRIDDAFLSTNDQDGLVQYYQSWLESNPRDVDGMARLARFLNSSARTTEATPWLEKAIGLAPSRVDLRKTLIDQLLEEQKIQQAILEYERLVSFAPSNTDYLRDWGKTVLKDRSREPMVTRKEAIGIWDRIVQLRPNDASTLIQVADLHRIAKFEEEATSLYQKAVEIAPNDPQYREYLGEYLYVLQRREDALKIWQSIAEGPRHTAENAARLAQVFKRFGLQDQAVDQIVDACNLAPKDFSLQLEAAEYLVRADRCDEAIEHVSLAQKLASNEDEREMVLKQRIEVWQTSNQLVSEIKNQSRSLIQDNNATAMQWYELARYAQAERQWTVAIDAIRRSLALDDKSIPVLTAAASIAESSGDLRKSIEWSRRLATVDRRFLPEHLMNIAKCETQLGRTDAAMQAARELINSAPSNTDHYEFLAQLCFRIKKVNDGLDALRKAMRISPNDPHLILALGSALADNAKPDEALALYWKAFDAADQLDDKTSLITKMVPLYVAKKQLPLLIERLQKQQSNQEQERAISICLAQVHATNKDFPAARKVLESLLKTETKDTNLLQQLAKVCTDMKDMKAAIQYQKRLVAIAPGGETEMPLAKMLMADGKLDEAAEIFLALAQRENDPSQLLKTIDSMLFTNTVTALKMVQPMSDDWELLYREGVALVMRNQSDLAKLRFGKLLSMRLPHETLGINAEERLKTSQAKAKSENLKGKRTAVPTARSAFEFLPRSTQIRAVVNQSRTITSSVPATQRSVMQWMPDAFGLARIASYAWLLQLDPNDHNVRDLRVQIRDVEKVIASLDRNTLLDMLYLSALENQHDVKLKIARSIAKTGPQEHELYLSCLMNQQAPTLANRNVYTGALPTPDQLSDEDLDLMLFCFARLPQSKQVGVNVRSTLSIAASQASQQQQNLARQLIVQQQQAQALQRMQQAKQSSSSNPTSMTGPIIVNGVIVGYGSGGTTISNAPSSLIASRLQLNSLQPLSPTCYLDLVYQELHRANKTHQAEQLMSDFFDSAISFEHVDLAMIVCLTANRSEILTKYYPKWCELAKKELKHGIIQSVNSGTNNTTVASIQNLATGMSASQSLAIAGLPQANSNNGVIGPATLWMPRWMGIVGEKQNMNAVFDILDPVLEIAQEQSAQMRSQRALQSRTSSPSILPTLPSKANFLFHFGKEDYFTALELLPINEYVDLASQQLLRQAFEVAMRKNQGTEFINHFRRKVAAATDLDRLYNQLCLAAALNWTNELDESMSLLLTASDSVKEDASLRFDVAAMLEQRGKLAKAMELVESTTPVELHLQNRKDWMVMDLAWRLGDPKRSAEAAERLLAIKLDMTSLAAISNSLRQQGQTSLLQVAAEKIRTTTASRVRSTPTRTTSNPTTINNQLNVDSAKRRLLQPSRIATSVQSVNGIATVIQNDPLRDSDIRILKNGGHLNTWLKELEDIMNKDPRNFGHYELLADIHKSMGDVRAVESVFEKGIANRPESSELTIKYAKHLSDNKNFARACELYRQAWHANKSVLDSHLPSILQSFAATGRMDELKDALNDIKFELLFSNPNGIQICMDLFKAPSLEDVAVNKFSNTFEFADARNISSWRARVMTELSSRNYTSAIAKLLPTLMQKLRPSLHDVEKSEWFGLDDSQSIIVNGKAGGLFAFIMHHTSVGEASKFGDELQLILNKLPAWKSGPIMISLLKRKGEWKSSDDQSQSLNERIANEIDSLDQLVSWNIARECENFGELRPLALRLYERNLGFMNVDNPLLGITPFANTVELCKSLNQTDKARTIIQKQTAKWKFSSGQISEQDVRKLESVFWSANQLVEMNLPMDAIKMYEGLLDDPNIKNLNLLMNVAGLGISGRNNGDFMQVKERCETGIKLALMGMSKADPRKAIQAITSEIVDGGTSKPAVDFRIEVTKEKEITTYHLKSTWLDALNRIIAIDVPDALIGRSARAMMLDERMSELRSKYPTDLSLAIVAAWNRVSFLDDDAKPALENLVKLAKEQARSDGEFRVVQRIPIWFVAQACLRKEAYASQATELADITLDAARMIPGYDFGLAIGNEWYELMHRSNDPTSSQQILHRMLADLVSNRPHKMSDDGLPRIAPLDSHTFFSVISLAKFANANNMPSLARKAIRESLIGGPPIMSKSDATQNQVTTYSNGGVRVVTMQAVPNPSSTSTTDASALLEAWTIVHSWRNSGQAPEDVYETLRDIVLPSHRPNDILSFYVTNAKRNGEMPSMATELIYWAKSAEKLKELEMRSDQRAEYDALPTAYSNVRSLKEMIRNAEQQP